MMVVTDFRRRAFFAAGVFRSMVSSAIFKNQLGKTGVKTVLSQEISIHRDRYDGVEYIDPSLMVVRFRRS